MEKVELMIMVYITTYAGFETSLYHQNLVFQELEARAQSLLKTYTNVFQQRGGTK